MCEPKVNINVSSTASSVEKRIVLTGSSFNASKFSQNLYRGHSLTIISTNYKILNQTTKEYRMQHSDGKDEKMTSELCYLITTFKCVILIR